MNAVLAEFTYYELLHQLYRSVSRTLLMTDELLRVATELVSKRRIDEAAADKGFELLLIANNDGCVSLEH